MSDPTTQQEPIAPGPAGPGATGRSDAAGEAGSGTLHQANRLAHDAGAELGSVAGSAKEQAGDLAGELRSRLTGEVESIATRSADALATAGHDLTSLAQGDGDPASPAADWLRRAGGGIERWADDLRDRGYEGVRDDLSRWARRNPGLFLAAAGAAGFALGRVFRAADTSAVVRAASHASSGDPGGGGGEEAQQGESGDPAARSFAEVPGLAGGGSSAGAPVGDVPERGPSSPTIDLTDEVAWSPPDQGAR